MASINVFNELSHITNHDEWRQEATKLLQSTCRYERHLRTCEFHGSQNNIDMEIYFNNCPFKFVNAGATNNYEVHVVLPPWKKSPTHLRTILQNIGCSTETVRVPKVDCEGAQHLMCLPNAQRMVETNGGAGSVVVGYSIFQGTKHWVLERHAVYKNEDGKLVDPTPPLYGPEIEPYTCFVEEPNFAQSPMEKWEKGHIVWMDKRQMKWMIRNRWYGNEIFMKGPSQPYKLKPRVLY